MRRITSPLRGISDPYGTRRLGTIARWGVLLAVVVVGPPDARADLEAGNLVGRPAVAAAGYSGDGVTVAIIDSGIKTNHPNLQGVSITEACFCTGGCCPNGLSTQFGPGAAVDADPLEHGTISANLIASSNSAPFPVQPDSNPGPGMAPDVSIVAIRIFPNGSVGTAFQNADLIAALQYIRDSQPAVDVVTMSLNTFALYPGACDSNLTSMRDVVDQLTAQGRILVSITGNQANKSNIGAPGCLDNVIAVGASWDAPNLVDPLGVHPNGTLSMPFDTKVCTQTGTTDTVACFSNSSPELDLLAPGVKATELNSAGNGFLDSAGTSEAAPIVAGCIADMLEANPSLDTAGVRQILTSSPTVLTDPGNARMTSRLDCADAVAKAAALTPSCGNHVVEEGEQCDDGNTVSGDGCSATCQNEPPTEQIVFDNGPPISLGFRSSLDAQFTAADDFVAPAAPVTSMRWYGIYFGNTPPAGLIADVFSVSLLSDVGGAPGGAFQGIVGNVSRRDTGMVTDGARKIYEYEQDFGSELPLTPGTHYWVSVVNFEDGDPDWAWLASASGPAGNAVQRDDLAATGFTDIDAELSFALVPEPGSGALGLTVFGALLGLARRSRP